MLVGKQGNVGTQEGASALILPRLRPLHARRFFTLPFCEPKDGAKDKLEDLGEVGDPFRREREEERSQQRPTAPHFASRRCSREIG